jgi:1,4-alpha-glucan branching enzyme
VKDHLLRFLRLYEMLCAGTVDADWLRRVESLDNLFPAVEWRYWA